MQSQNTTFTSADDTRIEHMRVLLNNSFEFLKALHSIKEDLDREKANAVFPADISNTGGNTNFEIKCASLVITPDAPNRPQPKRIALFLDNSLAKLQSKIKKYSDIDNEFSLTKSQAKNFYQETKQYFDLICTMADFIQIAFKLLSEINFTSVKFYLIVA